MFATEENKRRLKNNGVHCCKTEVLKQNQMYVLVLEVTRQGVIAVESYLAVFQNLGSPFNQDVGYESNLCLDLVEESSRMISQHEIERTGVLTVVGTLVAYTPAVVLRECNETLLLLCSYPVKYQSKT